MQEFKEFHSKFNLKVGEGGGGSGPAPLSPTTPTVRWDKWKKGGGGAELLLELLQGMMCCSVEWVNLATVIWGGMVV